MTIEEFVRAVKVQTSDAAVSGTVQCLRCPPGRKPSERLVRLANWYNQLDSKDQEMLTEALKETAEMAVFEFFCVIDGVSVIEDTADKGELELHFRKGEERIRLNDPHEEELHNRFNSLCQEDAPKSDHKSLVSSYDSGEAKQLKSKLKSRDEFDIHHIPDKYQCIRSVKGYDPQVGPAVILPKAEHRQMPPPNRTDPK